MDDESKKLKTPSQEGQDHSLNVNLKKNIFPRQNAISVTSFPEDVAFFPAQKQAWMSSANFFSAENSEYKHALGCQETFSTK